MHLLVRESRELDQAATPEDLGIAPADMIFLSYSDSDLASVMGAHRLCPEPHRPSLRAINLSRLRHPMSVDLFLENTVRGSKAVVVRLLGGLDYWRYGGEQLSRFCRAHSIALAIVPGDFRPDMRLAALSTVSQTDLAAIESLLEAGGPHNTRLALAQLLRRADGNADKFPAVNAVADYGVYRTPTLSAPGLGHAAVVFYRSHYLAGDVAPIDDLVCALEARGLAATAFYVPSLKAPDAARFLKGELARLSPQVILNATSFAARDGERGSPFDDADCPVLQVALAGASRAAWTEKRRGLSAADLAMHVVLPELDGRLFAGAISFKEAADAQSPMGSELLRHVPDAAAIAHVADLAAAWARLRITPSSTRTVALILSTYPGRPDQMAHAVGLDALQSTLAIAQRLADAGYAINDIPLTPQALTARLTSNASAHRPLKDYVASFSNLPEAFQKSVIDAWGLPHDDPACAAGGFAFQTAELGNLIVCLQPERGNAADRKAQYHDPATPPRHAYIAFYMWLRHVAARDAIIHLGAHGTLEWLPGKAVALSDACAPQVLLGGVPLIYPFIVNDPGEAAQAKRRIAAVTLGHRPPPMIDADVPAAMRDVERLVDEFASADGLDPRRRKALAAQIVDAAARAHIAEACGLSAGMPEADAITRIDAFLCDIKELSIRDGLHVLDAIELEAIARALNGRFIEPGPAGAPSRGRADVLPTGRNLYSVDPRAIPTPTACENGERAASAILERYVSDHGCWPRAIVLDLWGSATLRTGGEELATALSLLGVRPTWDTRSFRVIGIENNPIAVLGRPRVDVTLRISGLFRDMFATQLSLFETAVQLVAGLKEDASDNPLTEFNAAGTPIDRIFGPAGGSFGAGVVTRLDNGDWSQSEDLGRSYLEASSEAYRGDGASLDAPENFEARVRGADAFVHIQDHREIDLLTGSDFAAHEGGFAAAAKAVGNNRLAVYHGDTGNPDAPKVRTLDEECARIVHGRAANPRWIEGQMRHGFRGAAEMASTVDAAFAFAATARAVDDSGFERLYAAYLGDPAVAAFVERENPAAIEAMRRRFDEAVARGLWHPRRNDVFAQHREPDRATSPPHTSSEAAE